MEAIQADSAALSQRLHQPQQEPKQPEKAERGKELKILIWRFITVALILISAIVIIYFVIKGVVWVYDKVFGVTVLPASAPAAEQQQLPSASPFGPNSPQSSNLNPPPTPVSFFNVVPLPESPAIPALAPDDNSNQPILNQPATNPQLQNSPSMQNQNPAGMPPGSNANGTNGY